MKTGFLAMSVVFFCFQSNAFSDTGAPCGTRYPIVLSHHWSGNAEEAFHGDVWDEQAEEFNPWGIKERLEAQGAIVYQPNKIRFGSHETRGRLLYKKCAGSSLDEMLCLGETPVVVDGVLPGMMDYCNDPAKGLSSYDSVQECYDNVKINIICHSQGCPDSRYMISAVTNELSGKPMYQHVASWTSVAGINKGSPIADLALGLIPECDEPECRPGAVETLLAAVGYLENGTWVEGGHESIISLSAKYMTETMDVWCDPWREACPPSFNQAYPNRPEVYYQSISGYIRWLHSCYYDDHAIGWVIVGAYEGLNDGWVSLDSQRFTTAGSSPGDPETFVVDLGIETGDNLYWWLRHPGISHMGFSNSVVPGMSDVDCSGVGYDPNAYSWSREELYVDIVRDLKEMGF